ncbi:glycine cleavage system protein H [Acidovorax sp. FJL06]|uniref:glycine cleavage system protein H n=1 Tax=Acidovorax sp. FJL06 TaxID=2153365 RepID=UPI000F56A579|nr:glycine cleavage system protein GcvH [Acidovorax sp. FJL06]RQO84149.1 glycine cleavage system protein H [Acidovorax sp. FJL06]
MIRYSAEHLWVRLDENGPGAVAGITRHAQDTLGDIVLVDVGARGPQAENTVIGTVESVKTASDLHMPLDADIVEVNPALQDNPGLVNEDPQGAGWMVRLERLDSARFATLMDEAAYQAHTGA